MLQQEAKSESEAERNTSLTSRESFSTINCSARSYIGNYGASNASSPVPSSLHSVLKQMPKLCEVNGSNTELEGVTRSRTTIISTVLRAGHSWPKLFKASIKLHRPSSSKEDEKKAPEKEEEKKAAEEEKKDTEEER